MTPKEVKEAPFYYLRKDDRAIYKHSRLSRWYRGPFTGIDGRYQGCKFTAAKR